MFGALALLAAGCGNDDDDGGNVLGDGATNEGSGTTNEGSGTTNEGSGTGDGPDDDTPGTPSETSGYTEEVRAATVGACEANNTAEFCSCFWDEIVRTVPWEEFEAADQEARENSFAEPPASILAAVEACR